MLYVLVYSILRTTTCQRAEGGIRSPDCPWILNLEEGVRDPLDFMDLVKLCVLVY